MLGDQDHDVDGAGGSPVSVGSCVAVGEPSVGAGVRNDSVAVTVRPVPPLGVPSAPGTPGRPPRAAGGEPYGRRHQRRDDGGPERMQAMHDVPPTLLRLRGDILTYAADWRRVRVRR